MDGREVLSLNGTQNSHRQGGIRGGLPPSRMSLAEDGRY